MNNINIKKINGLETHYISDTGIVFSQKSDGKFKELKTHLDGKGRYEVIKISEKGKRYHYLIHRLVAIHFLPNPNNYNEINHIDYNEKNNHVSNLEWCNRKQNMEHCFKKHSQVRNFKECDLYKDGVLIKHCKSVSEASRYAKEMFDASYSMLHKHHKQKDIEIVLN